jgi:hypothetical protein
MPALLPIILTVSHVVLAADTVPKFDVERTYRPATQWACQGELLQRASVMKTMHGPSSSRSGPGTTQHSAVSASILLGSIVRPATLNC